jgi:N-acetyl-beta-hexosaminidase
LQIKTVINTIYYFSLTLHCLRKAIDTLYTVYDEVVNLFGSRSGGLFHIGGDEVIVGSDDSWAACYNSSTLGVPILEMINNLGLSRDDPETFYSIWQNFTANAGSEVNCK